MQELIEIGVQGIITDYPKTLVKLLDSLEIGIK